MNRLGDSWPLYQCAKCKSPYLSLVDAEKCAEADEQIAKARQGLRELLATKNAPEPVEARVSRPAS